MQSYHVVAACTGYTRNAVTSKALSQISLNSESGKG